MDALTDDDALELIEVASAIFGEEAAEELALAIRHPDQDAAAG